MSDLNFVTDFNTTMSPIIPPLKFLIIILGGKIAKCDMKTGSWIQQATGKCVAKPWDPTDSKCHCPKGKVKNGAWKCKTVLSSEFR